MRDIIIKFKGTIAIVLWLIVLAWAYNLDWSKKSIIKQEISHKTIEEIIATPVDHSESLAWDTEFRSSVEAIK